MLFTFFRDASENEGVNFKEFVRTLAYFRPIKKKTENPLNTRQHKLECKWKLLFIFYLDLRNEW